MSLETYATRLWVQPLRARRRRARSISNPGRTASNRSRPCGPLKNLVRLVPHLTTRKVRCVTPAPSSIRVLSSSIGSVPRWSNNRTPSPSRTGTRSTCISSRSPALIHCCTRLAPITPTSLSPATAFACSMALSRPSVTNVNGDPSETSSCGTVWVTTKTGTSKGCLPPHPLVRSNVLRPVTNAPVVLRVSRRSSALSGETLNTISVLGSLYSVSPPEYHAKSRSPPSPRGASGPSFGPAINPSSDVECPVRTLPMFVLLSRPSSSQGLLPLPILFSLPQWLSLAAELPRTALPRNCPKRGSNNTPSVDLRGIQRTKWIEKYRFNGP